MGESSAVPAARREPPSRTQTAVPRPSCGGCERRLPPPQVSPGCDCVLTPKLCALAASPLLTPPPTVLNAGLPPPQPSARPHLAPAVASCLCTPNWSSLGVSPAGLTQRQHQPGSRREKQALRPTWAKRTGTRAGPLPSRGCSGVRLPTPPGRKDKAGWATWPLHLGGDSPDRLSRGEAGKFGYQAVPGREREIRKRGGEGHFQTLPASPPALHHPEAGAGGRGGARQSTVLGKGPT